MNFKERLIEIKKVYNVDIESLRTEESKEDDKRLNRKRKYKNSFYIPQKTFEEIYNNGIIKKLEFYRVITNNFTVESNGGYGYILTLKK